MTGKILAVAFAVAALTSAAKTPAVPNRTNPADSTVLRADDFKDPREAARLLAQKAELTRKMHLKRVELLNSDPKLKRLHRELLQQAAALSRELESKREMRSFSEALGEVDSKIGRLQKK